MQSKRTQIEKWTWAIIISIVITWSLIQSKCRGVVNNRIKSLWNKGLNRKRNADAREKKYDVRNEKWG